MPRGIKKTPTSVETKVEATTEATVSTSNQPAVDHVDIIDESGNLVRTYSLADHGEGFASLADQFVAGHSNCHKR